MKPLYDRKTERCVFEPGDQVLVSGLLLDTILVYLSPSQSVEMITLLHSFPELFGDKPTRTDWA